VVRDQNLAVVNHGRQALETIDSRFRFVAERFPDRVAIGTSGETLSYRALDSMAEDLAHDLREAGVRPGDIVELCIGRHPTLIAAMLAIGRVGAVYLPLDAELPRERATLIREDAGPTARIETDASGRIVISTLPLRPDPDRSATLPTDAYVIYTSGSTGRPKGVIVTHQNILALFDQVQEKFQFDERDVWTLFHSPSFDFSVWEIWGALLNGGRLAIAPHDVTRAPEAFARLLAQEQVTVLNQTPSAFRSLTAHYQQAEQALPFSPRLVIFGGERLDVVNLAWWLQRPELAGVRWVNMYGITEVTVHASWRVITADDLSRPLVSPIGEPLPRALFHVLDSGGQTVRRGETGELYVSGSGVARGYLGNPKLTAERFVVRPDLGQDLLYRTGDLVLQEASGEYVYKGRCDDQLKVRGFRIEPAEVEAAIRDVAPGFDCAVTAHDFGEGDWRLIAFVTGCGSDPEWRRELRAALAERLPRYMIPSKFIAIDHLPITLNGKVDRRALTSMA
jgi:amino acid adenylation domain-containing protein